MTFDKIKMNQKNQLIKKSKCQPNRLATSESGSMKKDINDNLMNTGYLSKNLTVDNDMICQYSGLPSLKSYKNT